MAARASSNRRNLTLTVSIKHQMQLNEIFLRGHLTLTTRFGPARPITDDQQKAISLALHLDSELSLFRVPWAQVKGTEYKSGTIVIHDIGDLGKINFMVVENVYVYSESRVVFRCILLDSIDFDDHFNCYEVQISEKKIFIYQGALVSHVPNNMNVASSGKKYVTLRSAV